MTSSRIERTLLAVKPCAVQRGLIGEVITRIERRGLKIIAMKMKMLTPELLKRHYSHLVDKPFYPLIEASMMAAPVVLMCIEGVEAARVVRAMAGDTNGRNALPGTIRGDYCVSGQENIVHSSDSLETAEKELNRFFQDEDYMEYDSPLVKFIYADDELSS